MAIIKMLSSTDETYPAGAYCNWDTLIVRASGKGVPLVETHTGLCLFERERNMHDDSDFYMTVWNEEKGEPEEIMFATTRAWTYPAFASKPDATDEVWAKYRKWESETLERQKAEKISQARYKRREMLRLIQRQESYILEVYGVTPASIVRLRKGYGGIDLMNERNDYLSILNLLASKRIRSNFKLSMRRQVVEWLKNPEPKYDKPLSPKQTGCL